jgi:hypothetical protein
MRLKIHRAIDFGEVIKLVAKAVERVKGIELARASLANPLKLAKFFISRRISEVLIFTSPTIHDTKRHHSFRNFSER